MAGRAPPAATHVYHKEAGGLDVPPGHDIAAQQVLAPVAEVGELPPEKGDPGRGGNREPVILPLRQRGSTGTVGFICSPGLATS